MAEYPPINTGNHLNIRNIRDLAFHLPGDGQPVHGAPAEGIPLLTNGHLGADLLYVAPGDSFPLHVHAGHHFLYCVMGKGTVTFGGVVHQIVPGDLYMIQADIEHAVGSDPDGDGHWLVAFGAPHAQLDSHERMEVIE